MVVNGPRRNRESTKEQLYKLGNLYWRRLSLVRDPAARWCDLVSVDRRIDRALLGLVWTGRRALEQGEISLIEASDDDESFAGSAALLASGGEAGASRVCGHIISAEDHVVGCVDALCVLNSSAALAPVEALFARTDRPEVRAGLLPYLAEKGRLPTLSLLALLDDPHDEVAIRAAELLARSGRTPHGCSAIEERARKKLPQERRCALLFAAVALGSDWALAECRRLVADGHAISMNIINALVVAGGRADAELLLDFARGGDDEFAAVAILAAGHLGSMASLRHFRGRVAAAQTSHLAKQAICGAGDLEHFAAARFGDARRLLRGEPWSLTRACARLSDPEELLVVREWCALELPVRSGSVPPAVYDRGAPRHGQEKAAEVIRSAFERSPDGAEAGRWFYFGRPAS